MKNFFLRIWHGLTIAGRIIFGVLILAIVAGAIYLIVDKNDDKKSDDENQPEVAQTFEPSIGAPLPPDNPGGVAVSGQVGGASTTEPSTTPTTPVETSKAPMTAPETGIDPSKPIPYTNNTLKFAATLPAGSNVKEEAAEISFTSSTGQILYVVSTNDASQETLADIQAQLSNSTSAQNITSTKFAGRDALKFTATGFGSGIAFIANGKIYYLLGNSKQFENFKLI